MNNNERNNVKTYKILLSLGDKLISMADTRSFLHMKCPSFDGHETKKECMYDKDILRSILHSIRTIRHIPVMKDYGKWNILIYNTRQEDINDINILLGMLMNDDQRYVGLSNIVAKKYYQYRIKYLNLKNKNKKQ